VISYNGPDTCAGLDIYLIGSFVKVGFTLCTSRLSVEARGERR